jgi:hypothetical protein
MAAKGSRQIWLVAWWLTISLGQEMQPGDRISSVVEPGNFSHAWIAVPHPEASTLTWTLSVENCTADLLLRGDAQPSLGTAQRSLLGVSSAGELSVAPNADTPPCAVGSCVVHAAVRGASAEPCAFVLTPSLVVDLRGAYVLEPAALAGALVHQPATFGPPMPLAEPLVAPLVLTQPLDACIDGRAPADAAPASAANLSGAIALAYRGTCDFVDKAISAARAGALGLLVVNYVDAVALMGPPLALGEAELASLSIPALMIRRAEGDALRSALEAGEDVHVSLAHSARPAPLPLDGQTVDFTALGQQLIYFETELEPGAAEIRMAARFDPQADGEVIDPSRLELYADLANASLPPSRTGAAIGASTVSGEEAVLLIRRDAHPDFFGPGQTLILAAFFELPMGSSVGAHLRASSTSTLSLREGVAERGLVPAGGVVQPYSLPLSTHLATPTLTLTLTVDEPSMAGLYAAFNTAEPDAQSAQWLRESELLEPTAELALQLTIALAPKPRTPSVLKVALAAAVGTHYTLAASVSYSDSALVVGSQPPPTSPPAPPPPSPPPLARCQFTMEPYSGRKNGSNAEPTQWGARFGRLEVAHEVVTVVLLVLTLWLLGDRMACGGRWLTGAILRVQATVLLLTAALYRALSNPDTLAGTFVEVGDLTCLVFVLATLVAMLATDLLKHLRRAGLRGTQDRGGLHRLAARGRAANVPRLPPFYLTVGGSELSRSATPSPAPSPTRRMQAGGWFRARRGRPLALALGSSAPSENSFSASPAAPAPAQAASSAAPYMAGLSARPAVRATAPADAPSEADWRRLGLGATQRQLSGQELHRAYVRAVTAEIGARSSFQPHPLDPRIVRQAAHARARV